jgi:hypothetical protein
VSIPAALALAPVVVAAVIVGSAAVATVYYERVFLPSIAGED